MQVAEDEKVELVGSDGCHGAPRISWGHKTVKIQKEEEEEEEKTGGLGELGRRKRQQRRITQRLLYKDNKRRNRQKKDGSKAHGQERQTGEREVVVGEEVGFALF